MLKFLNVFFLPPGPKYPWKKVIFLITFSCLALSGSAAAGYFFYRYTQQKQAVPGEGVIQAIVQTTPQSGSSYIPLQAVFFAETLGLATDHPTYLAEFDVEEGKKKLLSTHALLDVQVKKMKPNLLYIQYKMRTPIAYLEDYSNTAVDQTGTLFPYIPYYPPSSLPKIYVGEKRPLNPWGTQIEKNLFELVQSLTLSLKEEDIERIDLSHAEASSAGKREIVILLKGGCLLRLPPKNYEQQINYYFILKQKFLKESQASLIDLRISKVAYIQR